MWHIFRILSGAHPEALAGLQRHRGAKFRRDSRGKLPTSKTAGTLAPWGWRVLMIFFPHTARKTQEKDFSLCSHFVTRPLSLNDSLNWGVEKVLICHNVKKIFWEEKMFKRQNSVMRPRLKGGCPLKTNIFREACDCHTFLEKSVMSINDRLLKYIFFVCVYPPNP